MSQLIGMGVVINTLGGNSESVEAFLKAKDQVIKGVTFADDALHFEFENGYKMSFSDEGQSCCERRYMTCDDDLKSFVGATLLNSGTASGPDIEGEYGDVHEVQFLKIETNKGTITAETHNQHNGYYGGFWVVCKEE